MRGISWIAALVSLGMTVGAEAAVTFGPVQVAPAAHLFTVGKLKLAALHDTQFVMPNDGKTFGVGIDTGAVSDVLRTAGAPTDRITLSVNDLLVHTGHRVRLIDTGIDGMDAPTLHTASVVPKWKCQATTGYR